MDEYAEQAEYPREMDRGPGAVDMLRDQGERLHHQLDLLTNQLAPVLRPESPEAVVAEKAVLLSPLDAQVDVIASAVERIIRVRDRLAI